MKKEQLREKFKNLYTTMIRSGSVEQLLRVIAGSMKQNFFVSLSGTDTYFEFNNPSSRKYVSRLHELGMLTVDSDIFDHHKPSHPIALPSGGNYADYVLRMANYENPSGISTGRMYISGVQYSYVDGFVSPLQARKLSRNTHLIPDLTIVSISTVDEHSYFTNKGVSRNDRAIFNTTSISFQKGAPPFLTYRHGESSVERIKRVIPAHFSAILPVLPRGLGEELKEYVYVRILDNDFSAQKRDKHRAFKTAIKLMSIN
jgi:hypothetical protein